MSAVKPILYGDIERWGLVEGDTLALLPQLPAASVDAVVTDPPYSIAFAGRSWDRFGGDRLHAAERFERWTSQWAAECRRVLKPGGHLVAFGAPRTFHRLVAGIEDGGLDVRDQLLWLNGEGMPKSRRLPGGLGTALKPAFEPILLARAPVNGTVKANVVAYGTGALDIDATRVGEDRWPANVVLSHATGCTPETCAPTCPLALIDATEPTTRPSRFFYAAKASRAEREAGCEELPERAVTLFTGKTARIVRNVHPTVKPLDLMRWLVRLICPPGGVVLDPFTGSGSTGAAALLERRQFVGIERERDYAEVACARIGHWAQQATRRQP